MKIDNLFKPVAAPQGSDTRLRVVQGNASAAPVPGAQVELSALSASLQRAESALKAGPEIDQARVDEIRKAMADGSFRMNAGRIADGLIQSVREMLDDSAR